MRFIHSNCHPSAALDMGQSSLQCEGTIAQGQLEAQLLCVIGRAGHHGSSPAATSGPVTSLSAPRNSGNHHAHKAITSSVPTPPMTTAGTVPNQCAVKPDSNCPNSFDVPINSEFTALTRPRILSGVDNCTSVPRMMTLIMSDAPTNSSEIIETIRLRESPNTIVKTPKPATDQSMVIPAWRCSGRCANSVAMSTAPIAGALRRRPNPQGPTRSISRAYTGNNATAPPSSTANKSSEIRPRISFFLQMKRNPANSVLRVTSSGCCWVVVNRIWLAATTDIAAAIIELAYTAVGPRNAA